MERRGDAVESGSPRRGVHRGRAILRPKSTFRTTPVTALQDGTRSSGSTISPPHRAHHRSAIRNDFDAMTDPLLIDDGTPRVRVLTLNRPERLNALDGPLLRAIGEAVREAADPARDIRVIVIRGGGRAFCSGSDLK